MRLSYFWSSKMTLEMKLRGAPWDWILRDMLLIENIPPSMESVNLQRAVLFNIHHVLKSNVTLGANQTFLNPKLDNFHHISYI